MGTYGQKAYFTHPDHPMAIFRAADEKECIRMRERGWTRITAAEAREIAGNVLRLKEANSFCGDGEYSWFYGGLICLGRKALRG